MKHFFVLLLIVTLAGCTETKQSVIKTDDELTAKIELYLTSMWTTILTSLNIMQKILFVK